MLQEEREEKSCSRLKVAFTGPCTDSIHPSTGWCCCSFHEKGQRLRQKGTLHAMLQHAAKAWHKRVKFFRTRNRKHLRTQGQGNTFTHVPDAPPTSSHQYRLPLDGLSRYWYMLLGSIFISFAPYIVLERSGARRISESACFDRADYLMSNMSDWYGFFS